MKQDIWLWRQALAVASIRLLAHGATPSKRSSEIAVHSLILFTNRTAVSL